MRAGISVTASNVQRIASRLVIGAPWTAIWATSSMSATPSLYQGSMHAVLAERDRNAERAHFRHAGHAAPLRIGVVAALQRDVDQRIGDRADARLGDQRQQLRDVVVVHRMHRRQMRAVRAAAEAKPLRLEGQRLDVARQRIVALVAMHVDQQAALRRDLAQAPSPTRRRRPSCARNAECRRRRRRPCRAPARGSRAAVGERK